MTHREAQDKALAWAWVIGVTFYIASVVFVWTCVSTHPGGHNYPKVEGKIVQLGPIEEGNRKAVVRFYSPAEHEVKTEVQWDKGIGESVPVTIAPSGPWTPDSNTEKPGTSEGPVFQIMWTIVLGPFCALMIGMPSEAMLGDFFYNKPRRSRSPRPKIIRPFFGRMFGAMFGFFSSLHLPRFKHSKRYRHVKKLEAKLKRMKPTPNVVAAREKVQALLLKLEEKENDQVEHISATADALLNDLQLNEAARSEALSELKE
jgi:hypothetical protein